MNPILTQRIPLSVRRLLTDIGPKEDHHSSEWTDAEPESVTRDGIQVPFRGAGGSEEFLTPADNRRGERGPADGGNGTRRSTVCGLCRSEPSCYTCPRCNVPYCGVACYRSPGHSACSEEFYKESVLRELKDMGQTGVEVRRQMQDVLLGLRQKASRTEGGMESVLRELEEESEGMKEGAQVLELLSRLAELQQAGEEEKAEEILGRLEEIGGGELSGGAGGRDVDGDDVEGGEELGLAERLAGLDIDALPEEALWELLDSQEKERFMALVRGGTIGTLVPLWRPWWEEHEREEEGGRALVQVLEEEEEVKKMEGEGQVIQEGSICGEEERRGGMCVAASTADDNDKKSSRTQGQGESSRTQGHGKSSRRQGHGESSRTQGQGKSSRRQGHGESSRTQGQGKSSRTQGQGESSRTQGQGESSRTQGQGESSRTQGQGESTTKLRKSKGGSRKGDKAKETSLSTVPPISVKIPKLSSLSSSPSPLVGHSLVNALFGYAFTLSLMNGDIETATVEFCDTILAVSEALNSGRVFNSLQEALECGEAAVLARGYLDTEDPRAAARAAEAVAHIMTGRSRREAVGYCLAALSQLRLSLSQARAALPKGGGGEGEEARRKYFLAGKKCEFYQAWASDNGPRIQRLAAGLWTEHSKREGQWISLEEDKRLVEEYWKKAGRKGKGVLIEELS